MIEFLKKYVRFFTSLAAHLICSLALDEIKNQTRSQFEKASNVKILNSLLDFLWNIFAETSEGRCSNPACACSGPHAVCAEHVAAAVRSLFMQIKPTAAE